MIWVSNEVINNSLFTSFGHDDDGRRRVAVG